MKKVFLASFLLLFPSFSFAAAGSLQTFLTNLVTFLSDTVVPFLIAVAFLFFVVNAVRYFVLGSTNEEDREKAKALAIYGVAAFVFIVIFWGIINLLSSSTGLEGQSAPVPDYILNAAYNNPTCNPGQTSVCNNTYGVTICNCQ